jgi:hypothetical protein
MRPYRQHHGRAAARAVGSFCTFRERQLVVVEKGDPERAYVFVRVWLAGHGTSGEPATSS